MVVRYYGMAALLCITAAVNGMEKEKTKHNKKEKREKKENVEQSPSVQNSSFQDEIGNLVAEFIHDNQQGSIEPDLQATRGISKDEKTTTKEKFLNFFKKKRKNKDKDNKGITFESSIEKDAVAFFEENKDTVQQIFNAVEEGEQMVDDAKQAKATFMDMVNAIKHLFYGKSKPTIPVLLDKNFKTNNEDVKRLITFIKLVNDTEPKDKKLAALVKNNFKPADAKPVSGGLLSDPLTMKEKVRVVILTVSLLFIILTTKIIYSKKAAAV